jgi:hypothetical protein
MKISCFLKNKLELRVAICDLIRRTKMVAMKREISAHDRTRVLIQNLSDRNLNGRKCCQIKMRLFCRCDYLRFFSARMTASSSRRGGDVEFAEWKLDNESEVTKSEPNSCCSDCVKPVTPPCDLMSEQSRSLTGIQAGFGQRI